MCSRTWAWRLRCIGDQQLYGGPYGNDTLPGGDSQLQYSAYCGNQNPARLLTVLLFFLQVRWRYGSCPGGTRQHTACL